MSAFSRDYELNGEDDSVSLDDAFKFIEEGLEADEIYMGLLIKNYNKENFVVGLDVANGATYKVAEQVFKKLDIKYFDILGTR